MKFTWNERKRSDNLHDHGLDFEDVRNVFNGCEWSCEDQRFHYPEHRFRTVGLLHGSPVAVIHTFEKGHIHVISFRKASRREAREYFTTFPKLD